MNGSRLATTMMLVSASAVGIPLGSTNEPTGGGFMFEAVGRGAISSSIEATGTVEAVAQVDVGSAVSGLLDKVFVNFNDTVAAGQPLGQLDRGAFEARVSGARAALKVATALAEVQRSGLRRAELGIAAAQAERKSAEAQAQASQARRDGADLELQRKLQLARTGAATDREVSQARTARDTGEAELRVAFEQIEIRADAIEIAEADAQMARANVRNTEAVVEEKQAILDEAEVELGRTVIRAPIDGVVISREVNSGQAVAAGLETKTLFRIARDLGEMQVRGSIDEADIGLVKEGEAAEFTVDGALRSRRSACCSPAGSPARSASYLVSILRIEPRASIRSRPYEANDGRRRSRDRCQSTNVEKFEIERRIAALEQRDQDAKRR